VYKTNNSNLRFDCYLVCLTTTNMLTNITALKPRPCNKNYLFKGVR